MVTLAIIGWMVFIGFFYVLEWRYSEDPEGLGIFLAFFAGLFLVLPIAIGLHYDIFGIPYDSPGLNLFKISGYVALSIASIGFIWIFAANLKSQTAANIGKTSTIDQDVPSFTTNSRSRVSIPQVIEFIAAVVALITSVLGIIAFYIED